MAKASVKQRAPAKRSGAPAKSKSAAKNAAPAARKSATPAKKAAALLKKPLAKVAKVARAVKAATSKSAAVPARPIAKAVKPAANSTAAVKAALPAKPAAAKAIPPVVAKPAPVAAKAAAAPAAKAAAPGKGTVAATPAQPAIAEVPKPSGRPMLSQGPFVSTALTKRGTFAPNKLVAPAPKPRRPVERPAPIAAPAAPILPPAPAVATAQKAQKNRAGLSNKDLEFFRDLLLAKRRELLGDMNSMEREALREGNSDLSTLPLHMADQGTDAYEQEFTLGLVEKDRTLLREINNALAKIQNGNYGICEGTGQPISRARLEAQPWAKHSIEHARALEKRQMMFRR